MLGLSRRGFISLGVAAASSLAVLDPLSAFAWADPKPKAKPFLFKGIGPGRGEPPPHKLMGEDLIQARLTPETWQLEIVGDNCAIEKPRTIADGTAIDFATLCDLGKKHGVKFLKAMQCRA